MSNAAPAAKVVAFEDVVVEVLEEEMEENLTETPCPVQDKLKLEMIAKEKILKSLVDSRNLGLLDVESATTLTRRIKVLTEEKQVLSRKLKRKQIGQKAQKKFRKIEQEKKEKILKDFPQIASSVKLRSQDQVGRPSLDIDQPDMMTDILRIATIGAACSDKRREDLFRSIKTLDDLHNELTRLGYKMSRYVTFIN